MQPKFLIILSVCFLAISAILFQFFVTEPDMNDPLIMTLTKQLEDEGYKIIDVSTTMLGRYHIEAQSTEFEREIVFAPGAGTFLRDDISPLDKDNLASEN